MHMGAIHRLGNWIEEDQTNLCQILFNRTVHTHTHTYLHAPTRRPPWFWPRNSDESLFRAITVIIDNRMICNVYALLWLPTKSTCQEADSRARLCTADLLQQLGICPISDPHVELSAAGPNVPKAVFKYCHMTFVGMGRSNILFLKEIIKHFLYAKR